MGTSVLVTYATRYGSTQEIAEAVAAPLWEGELAVDIQTLLAVRTLRATLSRTLKDAQHILVRHREALRRVQRRNARVKQSHTRR